MSVILAQTDCGMQWLEKLQQEDSMMLQPCDFEELRCLKEGSDHGRKPIPPFCEETMRRLQESGLEAAAKYAVDGQKRNQLKSRIGRVCVVSRSDDENKNWVCGMMRETYEYFIAQCRQHL